MFNSKHSKQNKTAWNNWCSAGLLNKDPLGAVYRIQHTESGEYAAAKIITLPQSKEETYRMKEEGLSEAAILGHYRFLAEKIIRKARQQNDLGASDYIVRFDEIALIENQGRIGWDIFLRMELLTSMSSRIALKPPSSAEVLKLGIHICRALELYEGNGIIHRNINLKNVFFSADGCYRLGGIDLALQDQEENGAPRKGMYTFTAPEIFLGKAYDARVDTYALGILMYSCLNYGRAPFLPEYPQAIKANHYGDALRRRVNGEIIPTLKGAGQELSSLILKACAYRPDDRFSSAAQMCEALESLAGIRGREEMTMPDVSAAEPAASMPRDVSDLHDQSEVLAVMMAAAVKRRAAAAEEVPLPVKENPLPMNGVREEAGSAENANIRAENMPAEAMQMSLAAEDVPDVTGEKRPEATAAMDWLTLIQTSAPEPDVPAADQTDSVPVMADREIPDETFSAQPEGMAPGESSRTETQIKRGNKKKPFLVAAGLVWVVVLSGVYAYAINIPNTTNDVALAITQHETTEEQTPNAPFSGSADNQDEQEAEEGTDDTALAGKESGSDEKASAEEPSDSSQTTNKPPANTTVKTLNLSGKKIDNSTLANMVQTGQIPKTVVTLNLSNNKITDVSSLSSLTNLRTLNLEGNNLATLMPLQNLAYLTDLSVSLSNDTVYGSVLYLPHLKVLHISPARTASQVKSLKEAYEKWYGRDLTVKNGS